MAIAVLFGDAGQAMENKTLQKSLEVESSPLATLTSDLPQESSQRNSEVQLDLDTSVSEPSVSEQLEAQASQEPPQMEPPRVEYPQMEESSLWQFSQTGPEQLAQETGA